MIELQNIFFQYEYSDFQLSISALSVQKGESIAFVGPSGCGKSTLLNVIAGELVAQKGSVSVLGQNLGKMSLAQRQNFRIQNIGFVFQDFPLISYLSAVENILLPYRINPELCLRTADRERAEKLLEQVGLRGKSKRLPKQLSQGERQRVAIARALITNPSLILADEPTAGLDPQRAQSVMTLLDQMVEEHHLSLVVVTHDPMVQQRYSHILDFGEMI